MTRVLLVLALLAPLAPLAPATGQVAEWWGPSDSMLEGWHIRVPVAVKNPGTRDVHDPVIAFDLDLSAALLEAGWTSGKQGASRRLQAFELDERSVRVAEYLSLDRGSPAYGVLAQDPQRPLDVRLGFPDRTTGYNNRTQPDVHVEWVAQGKFGADSTRWFMIYADVRANGDKAPVQHEPKAWAPLESYRWTSRGTLLVGRATTLTLVGLEDGTSALVEAYIDGRAVPVLAGAGSSFTNPVQLARGQLVTLELSSNPVLVRIQSDKPVVAAGSPATVGFVPSEDGSLLGRSFLFPAQRGFAIFTPQGAARVTVLVNQMQQQVSLPPQSVQAFQGTWPDDGLYSVRSDAPILVQAWPRASRVQLPTSDGAPIGTRLQGIPVAGSFYTGDLSGGGQGQAQPPSPRPPCSVGRLVLSSGDVVVTTFEREVHARGRDYITARLAFPPGDAGLESRVSARVTMATPWRFTVPDGTQCPILLHSAPRDDVTFLTTGGILAYAGASISGGRLATPLGGKNATSFIAYENVTVVALHNGTSVTVTRETGVDGRPAGLAAGDSLHVPTKLPGLARIDATKPVVVVPEAVGGYFAGVDASLKAERLGPADHRGYLVSVEPAGDAAEPMVGVAAPGKPATYKLLVKNLARDARGSAVTDTVRLAVSPLPDGWRAQLTEDALRLDGGQSREVTLTVLPPDAAEEGTSVTFSVTASSDALPAMADRLQVVTQIRARYGVDLWLDREGGPKSRTIVFEKAQETRVSVVVKNLASVADHILVTAAPLSDDWHARFEESGRDILEMELAPGATRTVQVIVRAPADGGSQSLLPVVATSLSDASAAAQVSAGLRMRSDARIALDVDAQVIEALPGEEARFRVVFRNLGTEAIGIEMNTTGSLPTGWTRPETYVGEHHIDELEGLLPGSATPLDVVARVPRGAVRGENANLHFVVRTLPQFVGDVVLRESVDLRVVVAADHRLTFTDATSDVVADEAGVANARVALQNGGNLDEALRVRPLDLPLAASFAAPPPLALPRGENGSITVTLRIPVTSPAGTYRADLELVADDGVAFPWRVNVTLLPRALVTLEADSPPASVAGVPTHARIEVRNAGNVPLALPPRLLLPEGWSVAWDEPALRELPPGGSTSLGMRLLVPREQDASQHELRSDPDWAAGGRLAWDVDTVRLRAQVLDGKSPTVRIANEGTGDARDVVVELLDDGVPRDQVILRRIPPGGSGLAVLVPPPGGSRDVTLRVDADARYADAPAELTVRVEGERALPLPAWLPLAAMVLALLMAARRR